MKTMLKTRRRRLPPRKPSGFQAKDTKQQSLASDYEWESSSSSLSSSSPSSSLSSSLSSSSSSSSREYFPSCKELHNQERSSTLHVLSLWRNMRSLFENYLLRLGNTWASSWGWKDTKKMFQWPIHHSNPATSLQESRAADKEMVFLPRENNATHNICIKTCIIK